MCHAAVVGHEIVGRVFRRDSTLHSETVGANFLLISKTDFFVGQFHSLSDQDLALHDIDIGDLLRHRVLDLNTRIHFDEVKLIGIHIDEKLDGSSTRIIDRFTNLYGGIQNAIAQRPRQIWSRCEFDHFLMPTLYGAVTFKQMHEVAVFVTQQLHFDMLGTGDELLDKHVRATEGGSGFVAS